MTKRLKEGIDDGIAGIRSEIGSEIEKRLKTNSNSNTTVGRNTIETNSADDDRLSDGMFENRTDRQRRSSEPTPQPTMTSAPLVFDISSPAVSPRTDRNYERRQSPNPRNATAPCDGGQPLSVTPPVTSNLDENRPLFVPSQPVPIQVVQQNSEFSAKINAKLCDKYTGYSHFVDVQVWLDVFTAVSIDWTDRDRLRALPRHLGDEAIEWFGQEIVPEISTISWTECKRRMIARFSHTIGNPIVEAVDRRLSSRETVTDYFNDKRRLLVKSGVSDAVQVELLTSGMPDYYKPLIKGRDPKTASEWIQTELMFERKDRSKGFPRAHESAHYTELENDGRNRNDYKRKDRSKPWQRNANNDDIPPTDPCPRCTKLGFLNERHWMRKCPRINTEVKLYTNNDSARSRQGSPPPSVKSLDELGFVHIDVRVNSKNFRPFLDTGSKITCMSSKAALSAGLHPKPSTAITIRQVDGITRTKGVVIPRLTIGKITQNFPIHVLPNLAHDMLLGIDAGIAFKMKVDLSSASLMSNRHRTIVTLPDTLHLALSTESEVFVASPDQFDESPIEEKIESQHAVVAHIERKKRVVRDQQSKFLSEKPIPDLDIDQIPSAPNRVWTLNIVEIGSTDRNIDKKFVITAVDQHTQYRWAVAVKNITSQGIANFLTGHFAIVGQPRTIIALNDTIFTSKPMRKFFAKRKIRFVSSSSRTKVIDESIDSFVTDIRSALTDNPSMKVAAAISLVLESINNRINVITGFTPRFLTLGIHIGVQSSPEISLGNARRLATERLVKAQALSVESTRKPKQVEPCVAKHYVRPIASQVEVNCIDSVTAKEVRLDYTIADDFSYVRSTFWKYKTRSFGREMRRWCL